MFSELMSVSLVRLHCHLLQSELGVLQTLDIVAENPNKFRVVALAAGSNVTLLSDQVNNLLPCPAQCDTI